MIEKLRKGFVNVGCLSGLYAFLFVIEKRTPDIPPIFFILLMLPVIIYFFGSLFIVAFKLITNK